MSAWRGYLQAVADADDALALLAEEIRERGLFAVVEPRAIYVCLPAGSRRCVARLTPLGITAHPYWPTERAVPDYATRDLWELIEDLRAEVL